MVERKRWWVSAVVGREGGKGVRCGEDGFRGERWAGSGGGGEEDAGGGVTSPVLPSRAYRARYVCDSMLAIRITKFSQWLESIATRAALSWVARWLPARHTFVSAFRIRTLHMAKAHDRTCEGRERCKGSLLHGPGGACGGSATIPCMG